MRFVIGIVLTVKANIKQWRESKGVKEAIKVVRNEFDDFVRQNTGLQPQLQLPINYMREILSDKNVCLLSDILGSIEGSKALNNTIGLEEFTEQRILILLMYQFIRKRLLHLPSFS